MNSQETLPPQSPYAGFEAAAEAAPVHESLQGGVEYSLDPNAPLAHDDRYDCDISAVITADKRMAPGQRYGDGEAPDSFVIADLRRQPVMMKNGAAFRVFNGEAIAGNVDFLLLSKDYQKGSGLGLKGVRLGETVTVGHEQRTAERFNLADTTSRKHFSIRYNEDGRLSIIDHNSTNGTSISSANGVRERVQWQSRQEQERIFAPGPQVEEPAAEPEQPKDTNPYGLTYDEREQFDELKRQFGRELSKNEVDEGSMAGLLKHVNTLRDRGLPEAKIYKIVVQGVHPDRAKPDSAEYLRRNALFKAAGKLLNH